MSFILFFPFREKFCFCVPFHVDSLKKELLDFLIIFLVGVCLSVSSSITSFLCFAATKRNPMGNQSFLTRFSASKVMHVMTRAQILFSSKDSCGQPEVKAFAIFFTFFTCCCLNHCNRLGIHSTYSF